MDPSPPSTAVDWTQQLFERLAERPICGYGNESTPAVEPTALTAMALCAKGFSAEANCAAIYLADLQNRSGSVGVRPSVSRPAWTTSLAILTWLSVTDGPAKFAAEIEAAKAWTIDAKGVPIFGDNESGHDTSLIGWSWAENTHSWMEPTILHVLSLKALGLSDHPRVREAIRMLVNRILPGGGCNYGNTSVMGQVLRPHLQPSGMLLLALADEPPDNDQWSKTIDYVSRNVSDRTTTASLSWALLGLSAVQSRPAESERYLAAAYDRCLAQGAARQALALLAHAQLAAQSPLCLRPTTRMAHS